MIYAILGFIVLIGVSFWMSILSINRQNDRPKILKSTHRAESEEWQKMIDKAKEDAIRHNNCK